VGASADQLASKVYIGLGTLAGSTIMLLTIPWAGCLWYGRCDLHPSVDGELEAVDGQCSGFHWKNQGVTVFEDVPANAKIMMLTVASYIVITLPTLGHNIANAHHMISLDAPYARLSLATCTLFFLGYLVYLLLNVKLQERKFNEVRQRRLKEQVVANWVHALGRKDTFSMKDDESDGVSAAAGKGVDIRGLGQKWRRKAAESVSERAKGVARDEIAGVEESEGSTAFSACLYLLAGTVIVSVFSDPMVDVIDAFSVEAAIPSFFTAFIITPLASNASELVSSLTICKKKKRANASVSYAQLYGAATMNNTLVLGIFVALVVWKNIVWDFHAEVITIVVVTLCVGALSINQTIRMWKGVVILALYPLSLVLIFVLRYVFHLR